MRNIGKQLHSTCAGCIQWGGQGWSGYEISHVLCRMGGIGTWVLLYFIPISSPSKLITSKSILILQLSPIFVPHNLASYNRFFL